MNTHRHAAADQRYPAQIVIFCDHCGREAVHDYLVSDSMSQAERFEVARAHLRCNEGWSCTADGDFCPTCGQPRRRAQPPLPDPSC